MSRRPTYQPDPSEYEFLNLFFQEISRIEIIPGRAGYIPLTRRIERGQMLERFRGDNPWLTFRQVMDAYMQARGIIETLSVTYKRSEPLYSALSEQIEPFLDQSESQFPTALNDWLDRLPKVASDEGRLAAWRLLLLTALIPPERRHEHPHANFSTAYVFHFNAVSDSAKDSAARLAEGTMRYVATLARLYIGRGIPYLELVQVGYMGLRHATTRFTERGGAHFQHYASNWIRQRIDRYVVDSANLIRVPVHAADEMKAITRYVEQFSDRTGQDPNDEQIALDLNLITESDMYEEILIPLIADEEDFLEEVTADTDGMYTMSPSSFDEEYLLKEVVGDSEEIQPDEIAADEADDDLIEEAAQAAQPVFRRTTKAHKVLEKIRRFRGISTISSLERSRGVKQLVDTTIDLSELLTHSLTIAEFSQIFDKLDARRISIIKLRYGLIDGEDKTLEEVGQLMGVTRERIRQIESNMIDKLRSSSLITKLGSFNLSDARNANGATRLTAPVSAQYAPPSQEREWVEALIAKYIERGRKHRFIGSSQRARATLYVEVLTLEGKPLSYREIHARAVALVPELEETPLRKIYSTFFYRPEFRLIAGQGVFGLSAWDESITQQSGKYLYCPMPLLPPKSAPNRVLDSVMFGLDLLTRNPNTTARAFLEAQLQRMKLTNVSEQAIQAGFDTWAVVGLIEAHSYTSNPHAVLRIKTNGLVSDDMATLCKGFLAFLAENVLKIPELLAALARLGRADLSTLDKWVFGGKAIDLMARMTLLAAFNAAAQEGNLWKITPLGQAVLDTLPAADLPEPPSPDDDPDEDVDDDELLGLLDDYTVSCKFI